MLDWKGVHLSKVYVHSAIYDTYLVQWFSRKLWSMEGGRDGVCLHILLYVKLSQRSGLP